MKSIRWPWRPGPEPDEPPPVARPFLYATRTRLRDDVDAILLRINGPVTMAFRCRVCERTSGSCPDCTWPSAKLGVCVDPASAPCSAARDKESSANGLGAGSVVGYVAGGAFLVGGVVTALVMKPWQERRKGARVEAAPTLGGIVVRGTF